MSLSEWLKTFQTRSVRKSHWRPERRLAAERTAVFQSELLEIRTLLASDFGDAPEPYPTTLAEVGAEHTTTGPTLGATRDSEADGTHSVAADADGADEDGVTFGTLQTGQQDVSVTVNVQNAPSGARLDAWIDFDGDGNWGGADEHVFDNVLVVNGVNNLTVDVPSSALTGDTYARFRLSSAGGLGIGGIAADGEVEDYVVAIEASSGGEASFGSATVIGTDGNADFAILSVDLDGDSDLDIVSADDGIYWRANQGNGTFGAQQQIASAAQADSVRSVRAVDIDGDGDMDILSAAFANDEIAWFENDGSQTFTKHLLAATVDGAYSVDAADIDGDGDLDVVAAGSRDDSLVWYENDGSQTFSEYVVRGDSGTAVFNVHRAVAADVDRDGDIDIVDVTGLNGTVRWYENNGNESFSPQTISGSVGSMYGVDVADIDRDGDVDVVVASSDQNSVILYRNNGSQQFDEITLSNSLNGANSVFMSDIDGDGDCDIVASGRQSAAVVLFRNIADQHFAGQVITDTATKVRQVAAADIDGDGITDIVVAATGAPQNTWYRQASPTPRDFGDAPAPYPTTLAEDGARHQATGPTLGSTRDSETDGTHSTGADADGADEDGVTFGSMRVGQQDASVTVHVQNAPAGALLDAWIDFNGDGNWSGAGEHVFDSVAVVNGDNHLTFDVPATALSGSLYSRFRISTDSNLGIAGYAADGEVEDHQVTVVPPIAAYPAVADGIAVGGGNRSDIVLSDMDGDGDLDLVDTLSRSVRWHENQGNGNFNVEHSVVVVNATIQDLLVEDIDGDGDSDIVIVEVIADYSDHTRPQPDYSNQLLAWYENDGTGSFTTRTIDDTFEFEDTLVAADFDADGDIDLITGQNGWYENTDAGFVRQDLEPHESWQGAADVNSDGRIDLFAGEAWFENTGLQVLLENPPVSGSTAVDFDGDGDMDFIASLPSQSTIVWLENDGNQQFTSHPIVTVIDSQAEPVFADIDGDGDLDVLVSGRNTNSVIWYIQQSNGTFTPRKVADNWYTDLSVADLNSDGVLDILAHHSYSTSDSPEIRTSLFPGLPNEADFGDAPAPYRTLNSENGASHAATGPVLGSSRDSETDGAYSANADADGLDEDGVTFGTVQSGLAVSTVTVNVSNAAAGAKLDAWIDFDGDGNWGGASERIFTGVDVTNGNNVLTFHVPAQTASGETFARFRLSTNGVAAATGQSNDGEVEDYRVTIIPASSDGGAFDSPKVVGVSELADFVLLTVDIDEDGDLDILAGDKGVRWHENLGNGSFSGLKQLSGIGTGSAFATRALEAADINGDGRLDLVTGDYALDRIRLHQRTGSGSVFNSLIISETVDGAYSVSAADIDGDGDMDIVAAGSRDNSVVWFENIGGDVFPEHVVRPDSGVSEFNAQTVKAIDIDRDGDMDILNATSVGDTIQWYENNGNAVFTRRTITTGTVDVYSAIPADIDGDGDIDVVSASSGDDTIAWYENDGNQAFTRHVITNTADGAVSVFVADLNGDGSMDILSASRRDHTIAMFLNDGSQNFSTDIVSSTATGARQVVAGDIDNDGDLDAVSISIGNNQIAVYESISGPNATPIIALPSESVGQRNFEFSWSKISDAQGYEVWLTNATTGESPFINQTVTENFFKPDTPLPIGRYYIWVRAIRSNGTKSPWSTAVKVQINSSVLLHSLPRHGADVRPTISWDALPGAVRYELWVNNSTTGQSRVIHETHLTTPSYTPDFDLTLGDYRIWVRGIDASGRGATWSATNHYLGPQPVSPIDPTFNNRPTFEWTAIPGAASYDIEVLTPDTSNKWRRFTGITGTTWTHPDDLQGRLIWSVRAYTTDGAAGLWSPNVVTEIGGKTIILSPTGTTSNTIPEFTWQPVEGAGRYILHVETSTGTVVIREDNLTETSFIPSSALASGDYRVWIKTINAIDDVSGLWSSVVDFTITAIADEDHHGDILLTSLRSEDEQSDSESREAVVRRSTHAANEEQPMDSIHPVQSQSGRRRDVATDHATSVAVQSETLLLDRLMQDCVRLLEEFDEA